MNQPITYEFIDRDKKMIKNIYAAVTVFLVTVLLIGGIYLQSMIEVFTA